MSLFDQLVIEATRNQDGLAPLRVVVEKELLHHDILREMSRAGLLVSLTFIGGTCLRACYGSSRLSEDLDFTGGAQFSREEILADKLVAFALRPNRLKNRDLWDIAWLHQQGVVLPLALLPLKLQDHHCDTPRFLAVLTGRSQALLNEPDLHDAFRQEMRRFLPDSLVAETVEQPAFWRYLTSLLAEQCQRASDFLSEASPAALGLRPLPGHHRWRRSIAMPLPMRPGPAAAGCRSGWRPNWPRAGSARILRLSNGE